MVSNDEFRHLRSSKHSHIVRPYAGTKVLRNRESYKNIIDSNYVLTQDVLFETPSEAAEFVSGASKVHLRWGPRS
ncbi:hypothetical protein TASI_0997 [Taylorella asinigenitalis MCE3]|uniref:Uncharacterized protein n=1 Tax=Taylorella asinigenitalis (strain MCE3) TaxID=1008459 RepID=G4QBD7_TAYAM|nr:hypothetical protein TASI_0997 [Taylorella asinigenitalis MCE3]